MSARRVKHGECFYFMLIAAFSLMVAPPGIAREMSIGRLVLNVRGRVNEVVLVDPLGRTAGDDGEGIPGCSRWPGGTETVLDDSAFAASTTELMEFQIDSLQFGRYIVYARADSLVVVTLTATFDPWQRGLTICEGLKRADRVRSGRHAWSIDVRRAPPKGECAVRIAPLVERKRAAKSP